MVLRKIQDGVEEWDALWDKLEESEARRRSGSEPRVGRRLARGPHAPKLAPAACLCPGCRTPPSETRSPTT